jgi:hypothetical protein
MDTQLSRFWQSMTARPCRSSFVPFDGTISSERVAPRRMQPTGYTRREQRCLAGVSPCVGQRGLPVTVSG